MQISRTQNTNFGILIRNNIKIFDNVTLDVKDIRALSRITDALNAGEARGIKVYAELGQPKEANNMKSLRITTAPTHLDMDIIKSFRPSAKTRDYKRRTKWFELYHPDIIEYFNNFLKRQKGFIHHCTIDPHHRATPFDKPAWQPNPNRSEFTYTQKRLGDIIA